MTISPILAACIGFGISSIMSVGGISGAFLLLPFQVSILGFVSAAVTPTNHLYNIVAIPSGVFRYFQEGRLLWPLTLIITLGTLPGVVLGSWLRITVLNQPQVFKLFVGLVLIGIGSRLVAKQYQERRARTTVSKKVINSSFVVRIVQFNWKKLEYCFHDQSYTIAVIPLALITFIIGIIGGAYGIGGGAIIAPILISIWRLPVHTIAGAALFGTFITSCFGVAFFWLYGTIYAVPNTLPVWEIGIPFGLGGLLGMYVGARMQRYLPAAMIEAFLGVVIVLLGTSYVLKNLSVLWV